MQFAQKEAERLGFKLSSTGIRPIDEKIQAITDKVRSTSLNELRSFMAATNQMNKLIPNLANKCAPLRPLMKNDNEWKWEKAQEEALRGIKEQMKEIIEIKHFNRGYN